MGSVNLSTSVRVTAPWALSMSRNTPPAPLAARCRSSPTSNTRPPRDVTKAIAVSSFGVDANPASSMITRDLAPMPVIHGCHWSGVRRSRSWTSLSRVSAWTPGIAAPSSWAALACGANPTMVPPPFRHAAARTPMTVVFPVPAGARANWTRRPLVAMSRTIAACPVFSTRPPVFADHSNSARATSPARTRIPSVRPAAATILASAASTAG